MIQALPIQRGATLIESFIFVPETVYASKIESLYEPLFMKAKVGSEGLFIKDHFQPSRWRMHQNSFALSY